MSPSGDDWNATNHLVDFALAVGPHYALAEAESARIVSVSRVGICADR